MQNVPSVEEMLLARINANDNRVAQSNADHRVNGRGRLRLIDW
ncbi:hypothetical protein [Novipirellula aureliae]|nr:hypothetical protein [Novipirellula aureliae]